MGLDGRSTRDRYQYRTFVSADFRIYEHGKLLLCLRTLANWVKVIINEETSQETKDFITKRLTAIKNQRNSGELEDLALIIGATGVAC